MSVEDLAAAGGHWPILEKLLRDAEAYGAIATDARAQANLLYNLGNPRNGYWHIASRHQQELLVRTMRLVPRLCGDPQPKQTLEALFRLWLTQQPFEAISRWVKTTSFEPRALRDDERIYPTEGWLGTAGAWARECDVPYAFIFWGLVSALTSACRFNWFVDRGTELIRLNQYILLVGEKGTGKSVGIDVCLELLQHLNSLVWGWHPTDPLPKPHSRHPFQVNVLPEDTNQERLVRVLAPQEFKLASFVAPEDRTTSMRDPWITESTGLLALDELATFLGRDNWGLEKRVPWLNRIFASKPYVYHTGRGGLIELREIAVSLLAGCPPDVLRTAITPLFFQGGFIDRMVVVYRDPLPSEERQFPTPRPRDPLVANELASFLLPLTARFSREEMVPTPEAEEWYQDWYSSQDDAEDPREVSLSRRANLIWKLAATLAISDDSMPWMHARHFDRAVQILSYEWSQFRRLLYVVEEVAEDRLMNHLERLLLKHGAVAPKYVMRTRLLQVARSKKGLSPPLTKTIPLLENLIAAGRVVKYKDVHSGDASEVGTKRGEGYAITPEVAEELKQRSPSGLQVLRVPDPLELLRPDGTATHPPEAVGKAPEPEPETKPVSNLRRQGRFRLDHRDPR